MRDSRGNALPRQCFVRGFDAFKKSIALALGFEVNAKFCVDDIADHKRSFTRRILKGVGRCFIEILVWHENIEQDIDINGGDHRPRT